MTKGNEISSTGQVSRVDVKYVYISTDNYGCVFAPLSSILPPNSESRDVMTYLKAGDIVHFVAVKQQEKNGCGYFALKVNLSNNNSKYEEPVNGVASRNQVVNVSLVSETYAYATNDELGNVFIPGSAFAQTDVTKLDSYLTYGDHLIAHVRPQVRRSGCGWIAESAKKISLANDSLSISAMTLKEERDSRVKGVQGHSVHCPVISSCAQGYGYIIDVSENAARIVSSDLTEIICSILTWNGGDRGNIAATRLDEILHVGDLVSFRATELDNAWYAREWSDKPHETRLCDSFTQTAMLAEHMLIRSLKTEIKELISLKAPHIADFNLSILE